MRLSWLFLAACVAGYLFVAGSIIHDARQAKVYNQLIEALR